MFNPNEKQFKINDNCEIEITYAGDKLELTALSSGEKQLILILLRVVNTSDKPTILSLDEPEISLHLTWQESLIKTIKGINEQCQLIIVTHSPALVMNGWTAILI
jgi:ABC-type molybdenum transport system ATPase subunit/photorepair protein PhrA